MKKTIIALAAIMFLISCGGSSETLDPVDSTVVADTTVVVDSSVSSEPVLQAEDGELGNPTKRNSDTDVHGVEIIK